MVTELDAPSAIVARSQSTVPEVSVQPAEAETNCTPAGSGSVTRTPVASDGPSLVTFSV